MTPGEVQALVPGDLAMLVTPHSMRASWTGGDDVVVVPAVASIVRGNEVVGYRPGGTPVAVDLYAAATEANLMLVQSDIDFGSDPETVRMAAPRRTSATISSSGPPRISSSLAGISSGSRPLGAFGDCPYGQPCDPCDIDPTRPECNEPPPPPPPPGTYVPYTRYCFFPAPALDDDQDGLDDFCEYNLASALAPELLISQADGDPSRETYWAAEGSLADGVIWIFYAFAYHRDAGHWGGHDGDSEFVIVWAAHSGTEGYWKRCAVYTVSHFQSSIERVSLAVNPPCQLAEAALPYPFGIYIGTYPEFDLLRPLAPRVWVAEDKHGSYPTEDACEEDFFGLPAVDDNCDFAYADDTEVLESANLGQNTHRFVDCVPSRQGAPKIECLWSDVVFKGWLSDDPPLEGPTGYGTYLRAYGF